MESKKIVKKVFSIVEKDNDRHYYNGVTTHFSNPILLLSSYLNLYDEENPKFLKILIIAVFAVVIPVSIVGINFFEKTVTNPRIWDDWTCEQMEKFALEHKDDTLNDYQKSKFHEDLSECLSR